MIIVEIWLVTGVIMSILAWGSEYVSYKRNPCLSPKFKPTDYETILTYVVFAAIYPAILLIMLYRKLKR